MGKTGGRLTWVPLGVALVAASILLPWSTRATTPPILTLLDPTLRLFGLLAVGGPTLIASSSIGLWLIMRRTRGISQAFFWTAAVGVSLLGSLFYAFQWIMFVTNPLNPNPHAPDFLAPNIGVYAGLAGSLMILTGVILRRF